MAIFDKTWPNLSWPLYLMKQSMPWPRLKLDHSGALATYESCEAAAKVPRKGCGEDFVAIWSMGYDPYDRKIWYK